MSNQTSQTYRRRRIYGHFDQPHCPQGERRGRGCGRAGKKPEAAGLVDGTWNYSAVKKVQTRSRNASKGKGSKRGTKKARIQSSKEEESQEEKEDEAEFTEDGATSSNGKGKSRSREYVEVMWTSIEMSGRNCIHTLDISIFDIHLERSQGV
jgi:superfamily II DNA/RNA helicase